MAKQQSTPRFSCVNMKKIADLAPAGIGKVAGKIERGLCDPDGKKRTVVLTSKECKNDLRVLDNWFKGRKDKAGIPADFMDAVSKKVKCSID